MGCLRVLHTDARNPRTPFGVSCWLTRQVHHEDLHPARGIDVPRGFLSIGFLLLDYSPSSSYLHSSSTATCSSTWASFSSSSSSVTRARRARLLPFVSRGQTLREAFLRDGTVGSRPPRHGSEVEEDGIHPRRSIKYVILQRCCSSMFATLGLRLTSPGYWSAYT